MVPEIAQRKRSSQHDKKKNAETGGNRGKMNDDEQCNYGNYQAHFCASAPLKSEVLLRQNHYTGNEKHQ
jgi:hypothetical protein